MGKKKTKTNVIRAVLGMFGGWFIAAVLPMNIYNIFFTPLCKIYGPISEALCNASVPTTFAVVGLLVGWFWNDIREAIGK